MDLTDIYRIYHPTAEQYAFFSGAQGALFKIDHTLGHTASYNKFKKTKTTP
jgi:hypothetical protein